MDGMMQNEMRVRFLSGERWEVDETDPNEIRRVIAERLQRSVLDVSIVDLIDLIERREDEEMEKEDEKEDEEHEKEEVCVLVQPLHIVTVAITPEDLTAPYTNWKTCSHPDLIALLLPIIQPLPASHFLERKWETLWSNPHPAIVDHLVNVIDRLTELRAMPSHCVKICANLNPNDTFIDCVLAHSGWWLPETMAGNRNVRAVRICMAHFEQTPPRQMLVDNVYARMLLQRDPDVFDFAWKNLLREGALNRHLPFVSHHAHLHPEIGDHLLACIPHQLNYCHGYCTDERVVNAIIAHYQSLCIHLSGKVMQSFCLNETDAAVEWLVTLQHDAPFTFARNLHPLAVSYFVEKLAADPGRWEECLPFWEMWIHNASPDAAQTCFEWIQRKPDERMEWFVKTYGQWTLTKPNLSLVLRLFRQFPDEFPVRIILHNVSYHFGRTLHLFFEAPPSEKQDDTTLTPRFVWQV